MPKRLSVGLLGLGVVGGGVVNILRQNQALITARVGVPIEVTRVLVRDLHKPRLVQVEPALLTTDPAVILDDPRVDILVEVMGGVDPAREYIVAALNRGLPVVTANKELLAKHGAELFQLAGTRHTDLYFEASVAGGVPIIRNLKESLGANQVRQIMGIINGTTNYMLTRMSQEGIGFEVALREAQARGYAEADPRSDVEGYDAAYKLAILATIGFETRVTIDSIHVEGITAITPEDMQFARELGYTIKLLAIGKDTGQGIEVRVHPTFIPAGHPLAAVNDVFNAIFVQGDAVGDLMFYGRGAGDLPTGSAVVSDIIDVARNLLAGTVGRVRVPMNGKPIKRMGDVISKYYIRMRVVDRPGVLAKIAAAFGEQSVSIQSVIQKGREEDPVSLVFVTHEVREENLQTALSQIERLSVVRQVANVIRVEGERS